MLAIGGIRVAMPKLADGVEACRRAPGSRRRAEANAGALPARLNAFAAATLQRPLHSAALRLVGHFVFQPSDPLSQATRLCHMSVVRRRSSRKTAASARRAMVS